MHLWILVEEDCQLVSLIRVLYRIESIRKNVAAYSATSLSIFLQGRHREPLGFLLRAFFSTWRRKSAYD